MSFQQKLAHYWFKPYTPLIFFVIIAFGIYTFAYPQFQKAVKPTVKVPGLLSPTPAAAQAQKQTEDILIQLAKKIDLPRDEQPKVAIITDITKFMNQPFFKKAQNGDALIIYEKNQKAILYRPSQGRVVEVAPVALTSSESAHLASPSAFPNP